MDDNIDMVQLQQALAQIIHICQPEDTVVVCGRLASEIGYQWCSHHADSELITLDAEKLNGAFPLSKTPDLALITDTLERLSHQQGEELLGQLRNYGTHRMAVVVPDDSEWTFSDFIALGFRRQSEVQTATVPLTLFTYNIDTYNHKRAWNNPDNWANPEMWDKARW
ncbi:MAG: DUF6231 family protein [Marinobacter sp.]